MVVNGERLSDLRGVYIPPWALRILARSRSTSAANESMGAARGVLHNEITRGVAVHWRQSRPKP